MLKTVLEKMGYWQKESEFGKKIGCFKAPLGSLGLNMQKIIKITVPEKNTKEDSQKTRKPLFPTGNIKFFWKLNFFFGKKSHSAEKGTFYTSKKNENEEVTL